MREIKFRAWDGERLRLVWGLGWIDGELDTVNTPKYHGPVEDDVAIMQYTGLKDKNGVEIYEGDIVRVGDEWGELSDHEIKWGGDYPAFELYPGFDLESNNLMSALAGEGGMTVEVIGNIYENPELIDGKE